jgi:hypothetical protein
MNWIETIAEAIGYAFMVFGGLYFVIMFIAYFTDKIIVGSKNTWDCAQWILMKRREKKQGEGK